MRIILTHASLSYFRRLWSVWKNVLAMLLAYQTQLSLFPMLQSFLLPPTEVSGPSGLLPAGTLAAPLH